MNDTERKVLKWLYNDIGGRASHVMAYEFLLGDDASRRPDYPYGCHEFNRCLELIRAVPETREAVTKLAAKSRYWAALDRHWEALTAMLSEETGGNIAYLWGDKTTVALRDLINKVMSGHDLPGMDPANWNCAGDQTSS